MQFTSANQSNLDTFELKRPQFVPNKNSAFMPLAPQPLASLKQSSMNNISPLLKQVMLLRMLTQSQQRPQSESPFSFHHPLSALNKRNLPEDHYSHQTPQKFVTATILKSQEGANLDMEKRNSGVSLIQFNREKNCSDEFLTNQKRQFFRKISLEASSLDQDSTHFSNEKDQSYESASLTKKKFHLDEGIIIDNYLISDDLNDCVEALLRKDGAQINDVKSVIKHNLTGKAREKQRRFRKDRGQNHVLQRAYDQDPNWDKDTIQKLSEELGLKESQIYKWNWDKKKKNPLFYQKLEQI